MIEKQLAMHQAEAGTQRSAPAVRSRIAAEIQAVPCPDAQWQCQTHPGGCLFWQNSSWWVSLHHAYPASCLQSTTQRPFRTLLTWFFLDNEPSPCTTARFPICRALPYNPVAASSSAEPGFTLRTYHIVLCWTVCVGGLLQELKREERSISSPKAQAFTN